MTTQVPQNRLYVETNALCEGANGDWIFEAYDGDEQSSEEFLAAVVLMIAQSDDPERRLIKFMRTMADTFERQLALRKTA